LKVLQHLREIRVDGLLEKIVLGGAWRCHGDLDLLEKQLETKTGDIAVVRWSKPSGVFTDQKKYYARKRSPEGT
jgi:hypothetical protein